ncbi:MAG: SDR family NAD(P)-dependent oxidoreductase [Ostreibacterium sp.]
MQRKTVIVTGGTHGIGRACVDQLAKEGYQVLLTGRDLEAGNHIAKTYQTALFQSGDITNEQDCIKVVNRALAMGDGKIAGLVNNAGMAMRSDFHQTCLADWDQMMSVNVRSVYHMTRLCIDALIKAQGSVVSTASIAGLIGQKGLSLYTASKAALIGLTKALALEYGQEVRFNAICPGQVETRMMQAVVNDDQRLTNTLANIPMGRLGQSEEIANMVAWLLSDKASFINGAIIPIDGGESAGIMT